MRLTYILLAALLALLPMTTQATAQVGDVLLLEGKRETIFTNPLEGFLEKHPKLRPEPSSSANWRGYVATFAVRDGGLWLEKVEVSRYEKVGDKHERRVEDRMSTFFPGKSSVLAHWYTGVLLIPRGKMVNYVHMGYGSTFERYLLIEIREGKLASRREMTAKQFMEHRKKMFEAYKKTPEYRRQLAESRKAGLDAEMAEDFIFEYESANYLTRSIGP
jgi:hypothetical protein